MKRFLKVLLALILFVGAIWLARNPLARWRAESRLESLGYVCEELEVSVEPDFSRARIGPVECTAESGPIERVELTGESTVELEFLRSRRAHIPTARFVLRREVVDVSAEGETFVGRSNVRAPIVRLLRLFDPSRASHLDLLEIERVEVDLRRDEERSTANVIGENVIVEPRVVDGEPQEGIHLGIENVRIPTRLGADITFGALEGSITESEAIVEGEVGGAAHIGSLELARAWGFRLRVADLNATRPTLRFERR